MTTSRSLSMRILPTDPVELLRVAFDKLHDIAVEIDDVPNTADAEIDFARWNTAFDETHRVLVLEPWARKCNNLEWLLSVRGLANRELKATVASAQTFCEAYAEEVIVKRFELLASDAYELIQVLDESLSRVNKRTLIVDQHFRLATTVNSPDRYTLTDLKDRCIEQGEQADFERYLEAANKNLRMMRLQLRIAEPDNVTAGKLGASLDRLEVALLEIELSDS